MGRSLIDTASYHPDTLKMLSQAFDYVWREMAGKYHAQAMIEDRRNRLATIILGLADGNERDLARVKTCAMKLRAHAQNPAKRPAWLRCALAWGSRGEGPGGLLSASCLAPPRGDSPFLCSAMPRNDRMMAVEVASNAAGGFAFLEPSVTSCRIC